MQINKTFECIMKALQPYICLNVVLYPQLEKKNVYYMGSILIIVYQSSVSKLASFTEHAYQAM